MSRALIVLFRREPGLDKDESSARFEGYELFWPDGRPVAVGLNAFCKHGQRLLGLGKQLAGYHQKLIRLVCHPLEGLDSKLVRIPGYRVRRFFVHRTGRVGRIHFLDGTPTNVTFDLDRDEPAVVDWIGLDELRDGERQWIDLAAIGVEQALPRSTPEHYPQMPVPDSKNYLQPSL